jgi:hypothetical protein
MLEFSTRSEIIRFSDARFRLIINQSKAKSKICRTSVDKSASDLADPKMVRPWLQPWTNCPHRQLSLLTSRPKWTIKGPKQSCLHIFPTRASTNFKALKINLFHSQMLGSFSKWCRTSKTPLPKQTFLCYKVSIGSSNTSNQIYIKGDPKLVPISPWVKFLTTLHSLTITLRLFQDCKLPSRQPRSNNHINPSAKVIFSDLCNRLFRK